MLKSKAIDLPQSIISNHILRLIINQAYLMTTPYSPYGTTNNGQPSYTPNPAQSSTPARFSVLNSASFDQSQPNTPTPAGRGRGRGGTGAKRGRKPRGALAAGSSSPRPFTAPSSSSTPMPSTSYTPSSNTASAQYPRVHWAMPGASGAGEDAGGPSSAANAGTTMTAEGATSISNNQPGQHAEASSSSVISNAVIDPALMGLGGAGGTISMSAGIGVTPQRGTPVPDSSAGLMFPGRVPQPPPTSARPGVPGPDDEVEGDDEFLPAMADDDYSAQLSWQSQSKDNLKCFFYFLLFFG